MAEQIEKVELDPNLPYLLKKHAAIQAASYEAAEAIAAAAQERAQMLGVVDSGDYVAGIKAEKGANGWARVKATSNKSAWIEFGVPNHLSWGHSESPLPAHWILRSAAEQLGMKFTKRK